MSLPIFSPTRSLGDYLWEFAIRCNDVATEWEAKDSLMPPGATDNLRRFADELCDAEAEIAECRLGLWFDGRWSYDLDDYQ